MRSLRGAVGLILGPDLDVALGDVPAVDGTVEELQSSDGLVVWDLVAGLVDAGEGEVAVLAGLTVLDAVDGHGGVARSAEIGCVGVVRCEGDGFSAEPVADVVGVTVNEGDTDGESEDLLEVVEEVGPDEVTRLLEGVVDFAAGLGVVDVDAKSIHNMVLDHVLLVEAGGSWVLQVWLTFFFLSLDLPYIHLHRWGGGYHRCHGH